MSNTNLRALIVALLATGLCQSTLAVGTATADAPPAEAKNSAKPAAPVEPPPLPASAKSATKLELDAIRTQNALAAERAKGLTAANGVGTGPAVPGIDARPIAVERSPGRGGSGASGSARVTMVAGPKGQLAATIMTGRGLVVARTGDRIPDLGTIRSISVNQVLVEDGKRTVSIPFAAEPASSLIQGGGVMPGNTGMTGAGQPYGVQ